MKFLQFFTNFSEEFKRQCTHLGENTEKYITFSFPIKKEILKIGKNVEKKIKKLYPKDYNSLTVQDLGQGHFQILLVISQKVFIKLNLNTDMMMRSVKLEELKTKIVSVFLNTQVLNT